MIKSFVLGAALLVILCASCKKEYKADSTPFAAGLYVVSTLAGNGTAGYVEGAGTVAQFKIPRQFSSR